MRVGVELPHFLQVAIEVIAHDDEVWTQLARDESWRKAIGKTAKDQQMVTRFHVSCVLAIPERTPNFLAS